MIFRQVETIEIEGGGCSRVHEQEYEHGRERATSPPSPTCQFPPTSVLAWRLVLRTMVQTSPRTRPGRNMRLPTQALLLWCVLALQAHFTGAGGEELAPPVTILDHFQLALHTTANVDLEEDFELQAILDHAWDGA